MAKLLEYNGNNYLIPTDFEDGMFAFENDTLHITKIDLINKKVLKLDLQPAKEVELDTSVEWKKYAPNLDNAITDELNGIDVEVNITEEFEPKLPYVEYTDKT